MKKTGQFTRVAMAAIAIAVATPAIAAEDDGTNAKLGAGGTDITAKSGDDTFRLRFNGYIHMRYNLVSGEESDISDGSHFRLRRARLSFSGHIFRPEIVYNLRADLDESSMGNLAAIAHVGWQPDRAYGVHIGRRRVPFNVERVTSIRRMQFVDRTRLDNAFHLGYGQGIWAEGAPSLGDGVDARYWAGAFNGIFNDETFRQNDTLSVNHSADKDGHKLLYVARAELLSAGGGRTVGQWQPDLRPDESRNELAWMLGAAAAFYTGEFQDTDADLWHLTADARVHFAGFAASAGVIYRGAHFDDAVNGRRNVSDIGFSVQGGYAHNFEFGQVDVSARFSHVNHDDDWAPSRPDRYEYGLAANLWLYGENLRLSADATYHVDDVPAGAATNAGMTRQRWEGRFQVQLRF